MAAETSLARRVAWASALAASGAALVAAFGTIAVASYLVQREEDRRLGDAAITLARELDAYLPGKTVEAIVADEALEMEHTGVRFTVLDTRGQLLAGDRRLTTFGEGCAGLGSLRVCSARSTSGLWAVVAAKGTTPMPVFGLAAVLSVVLAAALAWLASRPLSRAVIAPLSRLRARIGTLEADTLSSSQLGTPEGVLEVDALRDTIDQLVRRVERAMDQANRFAANAAHELRTPLTSLRGELELLAEQANAPELRAATDRVQQLSVLVERLLVLASPRRGPADVGELVSMRDLVEDAMATNVVIGEGDGRVRGDAVLLGLLVSNAVANALKFGGRASTAIERRGEHVVLVVDDEGPGVPAVDRERVFDPFVRGSATARVPGHGLGLALIRHIAETHGGAARFVDKATPGARLEVSLPASS